MIETGAQLCQSSSQYFSTSLRQHQAVCLLRAAQTFDPLVWATSIQVRSPTADLVDRTHVAYAHRAAVCIYLSRVALSLDTTICSSKLEIYVADAITHLSFIRPDNALFTATTWPAFVAGAETNDRASQDWVAMRFRELWDVEPWGLIKGALGVLERIWAGKRSGLGTGSDEYHSMEKKESGDWIKGLRETGVDWLVV